MFFVWLQDILGWGESDRGISYTFGRDIVQEVMETLSLSLICRAHQVRVGGAKAEGQSGVYRGHRMIATSIESDRLHGYALL